MAKMSNYRQYIEASAINGSLDKPHIDKFFGEWGYWGGSLLNNDNKKALIFTDKLRDREAKNAD